MMDNLKEQRIIVVDCCEYKKSGETMDHLLLHCDVASKLGFFFWPAERIEGIQPPTCPQTRG